MNQLFKNNMDIIFIFYGLAFLILGITVFFQISSTKRGENQKTLNELLKNSLRNLPLEIQLQQSLEIMLKSKCASIQKKGSIFLIDEDHPDDLKLVAQIGLPNEIPTRCRRVPIGRCLCGKAARIAKITFRENLEQEHEIRYPGITEHGHYVIPIASQAQKDRVLGVICLYLKEGRKQETHDMEFFEAVANSLASLIERKQAEKRIEYLAYYDVVTDLPNWRLFKEQLDRLMRLARQHNEPLALAIIDIDRFKQVNEGFGHQAGDGLLRKTASRLKTIIRQSDMIARIGADEFSILFAGKPVPQIAGIAHELSGALNKPYLFGDRDIPSSTSIGIAVYPEDGADADELLSNANSAMRRAKLSGGNDIAFYKPSMNEKMADRVYLEKRLGRALENNEFIVEYQPIINLWNSTIIGAEALARWKPPGQPLVPPKDFIPPAEETGLIIPLGKKILELACLQGALWVKEGYRELRVSVNVSARQFDREDFTTVVKRILELYELPANNLELELTESVIMRNPDRAVIIMLELKDLGVHLSIDDFGTGYSSLRALKIFPIDTLKIDRSFISDMLTNKNSAAIIRTTVSMGKILGLRVIAEGAETEAQRQFLKSLKCDALQGYVVSPPKPARELERLLAENIET